MIALLALIVLGPEKLPKLAAKVGHWTGRARSMARNLRQQLENEVSYDDLLKQKQAAEEALRRAQEAPVNFHQEVAAAVTPVATPATSETVTAPEMNAPVTPTAPAVTPVTPATPHNS